jgi:hypothetical protein
MERVCCSIESGTMTHTKPGACCAPRVSRAPRLPGEYGYDYSPPVARIWSWKSGPEKPAQAKISCRSNPLCEHGEIKERPRRIDFKAAR